MEKESLTFGPLTPADVEEALDFRFSFYLQDSIASSSQSKF